jgi:hypothetical protein
MIYRDLRHLFWSTATAYIDSKNDLIKRGFYFADFSHKYIHWLSNYASNIIEINISTSIRCTTEFFNMADLAY